MLECLHIENIAVIERADIDFTAGFNVMTGETGAGKSIVIDSIFALLGERTSRELIRHGAERAVVSASFINIGKAAEEKLKELGFSMEDNRLIIQRTLFADGRGNVKIGGAPANVSTLKELGKTLINIHGQHDSQNLLNSEKHINYIDAYAENFKERKEYLSAFENFKEISKKLNSLTVDENEKASRADYLKFVVSEIEKADIKIGEAEKLKEFLKIQQNSEHISNCLKNASSAINGGGVDDLYSALDLLRTAKNNIETALQVIPDLDKTLETIERVILDTEQVYNSVEKSLSELEFDPIKAEKCSNRLDFIRSIMLKYNGSEEKVIATYNSALEELNSIQLNEKEKDNLEELLLEAQNKLIAKGKALTETRKKAAEEICLKITKELEFLDFNGAKFTAEITGGRYTKNGCDTAEFLISANIGEEPKPLAKIASGGELSRIMLAIRNVLSVKDDVQTLIFDEIDTGISGHAASKVATKLYEVAKSKQVICVTHLAQIASFGDLHLFISKSVNSGKTYTKITPLDYKGRVNEIARIISGGERTESLLKTAEEMLNVNKN